MNCPEYNFCRHGVGCFMKMLDNHRISHNLDYHRCKIYIYLREHEKDLSEMLLQYGKPLYVDVN